MVNMIDYQSGSVLLANLELGEKVVDPSWTWEFRAANNYKQKRKDIRKNVTWIVVAKNHYEGLAPHVTLLSEDSIGCFPFDDGFMSRDDERLWYINHWGLSGTNKAKRGLRPWLNSSDIHAAEGFAQAFSESFRSSVLITPVPNKDGAGETYVTNDGAFIPSTTEIGDTSHKNTYEIGKVFPFFLNANDKTRQAMLPGRKNNWYWTRSPDKKSRLNPSTSKSLLVRFIHDVIDYDTLAVGENVLYVGGGRFSSIDANAEVCSARPIVNLRADVRISKIPEKISLR